MEFSCVYTTLFKKLPENKFAYSAIQTFIYFLSTNELSQQLLDCLYEHAAEKVSGVFSPAKVNKTVRPLSVTQVFRWSFSCIQINKRTNMKYILFEIHLWMAKERGGEISEKNFALLYYRNISTIPMR